MSFRVSPAIRFLILVGFAIAIYNLPAAAQTLGTVTGVGQAESCPANRGFDTSPPMTCYPATLSGCTGDDPLQFVYGVETPSGTPLGTIVILSGKGGTSAADPATDVQYVKAYVGLGYQVVQIAWGATAPGYDWEYTNVTGSNPPSIRVASCRPASFLNWVRNGSAPGSVGIWGGYGGMCVQGESAGGGAVAYALACGTRGPQSPSSGRATSTRLS
jgi:hypothetical protein